MIKSDGKISVKNKKEVDISSDDIVKLDLTNNDRYYTIIIDEQFLSQGFVIESEGNYIIGVCF